MHYEDFETVIGLEAHLQLDTRSKAFCGDENRFGMPPNSEVSPISLGHPGTLPRLNARQVEFAIRLGLALNCRINEVNTFDRKNYFYADLPKGYQITQDKMPVCMGGVLPILLGQEWKMIRIHHIHMEEDAGKSMHNLHPTRSMIDLNRAGTPLLEIVTEPDLRSAAEVDAFMRGIQRLARYLGISDGNMEEGSLRCDINVSVRPKGQKAFGERCEIKNINSMRFARQAIEYEVKRQIDLIREGGRVVQQTLNFDPSTGVTTPLRNKEDAHDYRYFPEPDLPPVVLDEEDLQRAKAALPGLPWQEYALLLEKYELSAYEAGILSEERETVTFFKALCQENAGKKALANLLINRILPWCAEKQMALTDFPLPAKGIADFVALIDAGKVSASIAYQRLFPALLDNPDAGPEALARELNLLQEGDEEELKPQILMIIADFPDKAMAYRKGKKGLLGFFMGELMKRTRGKADPAKATLLFQQVLDEG
jgi:aspartyl-tRNA(Asn)/glutamyl-tRNA(Gln) amidotransferase subunit B